MSFDWAAYRANIPSDQPVEWEDAEDLSRLSLSTFIAEQSPVRRDLSTGWMRLTGPGVTGHSAPVEQVSQVMRHFQRLVLASGLSLSGFTTLQGRLPADVVSKTLLHLDGSALAGSLVLNVVPATLPSSEILPDGQAEFFRDGETQLVDLAVEKSVELLRLSKDVGADADASPFLQTLSEAGPRVASTLRDLASALVSGDFETEVAWQQPRTRRLTTRLTVPELAHLTSLVASRELAKEPTTLTGVVRTVSDISPLRVEIADGEIETIQAGDITHDVIGRLRVGMTVRIKAAVTEDVSPGGEVKTKYTASEIEVLSEPEGEAS